MCEIKKNIKGSVVWYARKQQQASGIRHRAYLRQWLWQLYKAHQLLKHEHTRILSSTTKMRVHRTIAAISSLPYPNVEACHNLNKFTPKLSVPRCLINTKRCLFTVESFTLRPLLTLTTRFVFFIKSRTPIRLCGTLSSELAREALVPSHKLSCFFKE